MNRNDWVVLISIKWGIAWLWNMSDKEEEGTGVAVIM